MSAKRKVGRNELCPCGSGVKYKKCCLLDDVSRRTGPPGAGDANNALGFLHRSMAPFERMDLLAGVGALELIQENQGLLVDLELLAQAAAGCPWHGTAECSSSAIRSLFASPFIAQHRSLRDPIDGLFAETVVGPGGQYILFPGLFCEGGFTLRAYLNAAFRAPQGVIPSSFVVHTKAPVLALLKLSTCIARRWGYDGWLASIPNEQLPESLTIPGESDFRKCKRYMMFSPSELAGEDIDPRTLVPFLITQSQAYSSKPDVECHPLELRPLILLNDTIIVVSPTSIITAIRGFLLESALGWGLEHILRSRLLDAVSWHVDRACVRLGMESCQHPDSVGATSHGRELVYMIDDDKSCLVFVAPSDIDETSPSRLGQLADRLEAVCTALRISRSSGGVLCIVVLIDGYKQTMIRLRVPNFDGHMLVMNAEELELLSMDCSGDPLALWRYCKVKAAAPEVRSYSFFNCWAFYRKHRDSFYMSDDSKPSFMQLLPGFEQERRCDLRVDWGLVAGPAPDPILPFIVELQRRHDRSIPIFIPAELEQLRLGEVVYLGSTWFWTTPPTGEDGHDLPRAFAFHLMETLSYWVWQIGQPLVELLRAIGLDHVRLDTKVVGDWTITGASTEGDPAVEANAQLVGEHAATVSLVVRPSLSGLLRSPDNRGEGQILRVLMRALASLHAERAPSGSGWADVEEHIDAAISAALGPSAKKMLLVVPEAVEAKIDPRDLPPLRTLARAYIEMHSDGLIDELLAGASMIEPHPGKDVPAAARGTVVRAILDVFMGRLRRRLKGLSRRPLLERLVTWNERLVREERFELFSAPTQAACWRGVQAQVERLVERRSEFASAGLSVRFLVEFVAVEPPDGSRAPSWDDVDELASLAYQYINWGYTGDQIRTGLADHRLSWLESGRVGVGGELRDWAKDFLAADSHEVLDDAHEALGGYYQPTQASEDAEEHRTARSLDEAFVKEFGISMTALVRVASAVRDRCEQLGDMSIARFTIAELKQFLCSTDGLEVGMLEPLLELFALGPGRAWDDPERVKERRDIEPWHFNRRWSYLHRPFVIVSGVAGEWEVLVGPRHIQQAVHYLQDSIRTGRYARNAIPGGALHKLSIDAGAEKGIRFQDTLAEWFRQCGLSNIRIETTVRLRPGKPLSPDRDLGDVDVFVLDFDTKAAFLIEAKDVNAGRTPTEMSSERENLTLRSRSKRTKPSASGRHLASPECT